ncbi:MAG: SDR family oxidoreductase [Chloroflexi bacterium]|nr:SDR family oxidoreductase [Chloroflexota bacterium]
MGDRLKGKVAVVTGAGRGIGRGIAIALAAEGAGVVVNDIGANLDGTGTDKGPADEVADGIRTAGGKAVAAYDSVATFQGGEALVKTAIEKLGRLDIVVHCAGVLRDRMIWNMAEEEWDVVVKVHLKGCFNICKPASVVFRQQRGGRMIAMTSSSGLFGNAGQANYAAAKDGIAGFIRVAARDLGRYGVTANGIAPGADTRMLASIPGREDPNQEVGLSVAPLDHLGMPRGKKDPDDVAPIVVYLCTDQAANINGQFFLAANGVIALVNSPYNAQGIQRQQGRWTFAELAKVFPATLGLSMVNPAPPQPAK